MSDENRFNNDDKDSRKNGEFRVPPKTWIVWIVIIGGILALVITQKHLTEPSEAIKPQEFWTKFNSNQIDEAAINPSPQSPIFDIVGKYHNVDKDGSRSGGETQFRVKMLLSESQIDKLSVYSPPIEVKEPNT